MLRSISKVVAYQNKNLLGNVGQGLNIAYSALIDGRLSVAAGCIGVMKDCLNETLQHTKSRRQHGSLLAKKQLIQQHISTIVMGIESSLNGLLIGQHVPDKNYMIMLNNSNLNKKDGNQN